MAIANGRNYSKRWKRIIYEKDVVGFYVLPMFCYSDQYGFKRLFFGWGFWSISIELSQNKSDKKYLCDSIKG